MFAAVTAGAESSPKPARLPESSAEPRRTGAGGRGAAQRPPPREPDRLNRLMDRILERPQSPPWRSDTVPAVSSPNIAQGAAGPPDRLIWLDGALVPWERATVHVMSHSLQRGSLIFDFLKVIQSPRGVAVFRLEEHVGRLLRSAELVGLPLRMTGAEISEATVSTVRANPGATVIKISAFIASPEIDVVPMNDHVSVAIAAYEPKADIADRNPGEQHFNPELSLWIEKERRNRRRDIIDPQAKVAANYVSPMTAKWAARRQGYDDVLLVDEDGFIAEGPTSNVFLFDANGVLKTPSPCNVLLGVTRRSIIDIAKHDGIEVHEEDIRPEELLEAREVFLSGTNVGVWPVVEIDRRTIGDGATGPKTRALRERFATITGGGDPAFAHWLTYVDGD
jgi:branched-chain amino acid aminotransferase